MAKGRKRKKAVVGMTEEEEARREEEERLLKYKGVIPLEREKTIETTSWGTIANLATEVKVRAESRTVEMERLEKEVAMTKMILVEKIKEMDAKGKFEPKFLVSLVKLLDHFDKLATESRVDLSDFTRFIYILIEKMKKEKLIVYDIRGGSYTEYTFAKEFGKKLKEEKKMD